MNSEEVRSNWFFSNEWGFGKSPPSRDFELYGRALVHCAAADGIAAQERDWIVGYLAAAGADGKTLELLGGYDGQHDLDAGLRAFVEQRTASRALVYDAIRACSADGELAQKERVAIQKMADLLSVPQDVVRQLESAYLAERHAMATRLALTYPSGLPF